MQVHGISILRPLAVPQHLVDYNSPINEHPLRCFSFYFRRATSAAAFLKCSVCNHEYRTERSYWMRLVSSEEAVFLLTVFSMLFVVISLGSVAQWTVERSSLLQEWLSFFYAVLEVPFPPSYCFHIARHSSNLWNILVSQLFSFSPLL